MGNILLRKTGLEVLQDTLLIQCGAEEAAGVSAELRDGAGLVVSANTISHVRGGRLRNFPGPLLVDRQRYVGSNRVLASAGISPDWIADQYRSGATVPLTDSGYIGPGDEAGLDTVLSQTARLGDEVVATLPLHQQWLNTDSELLIEAISTYGLPVALVVEHRNDPFSPLRNLSGLVQLIRYVRVPVVLLRSDTSALGALAFGAHSAGVGTKSRLRHLYPVPKRPGGVFSRGIEAALFDPGLYLVHVDKLARGVAALPEDPMWLCTCQACRGRRLDWMVQGATSEQILAHNVELLLDRRDHLMVTNSGRQREQSWRAACRSAEFQFTSVAMTKAGWEVPAALRHWQQV